MLNGHLVMLQARKPLLQMTPAELIEAYMTPLTLGVYLSFFLYGIFVISLFLYLVKIRRDTWMNRIVVTLLAFFTTADTISSGIRIFRIVVLHPANLLYVLDVTQRPEDWLCTLFLFLTILVSQIFLCVRIITFARKMSDWSGPSAKLRMGAMITALGLAWLACFGTSIANCVVFYKTENYMELLVPSSPLAQSFRTTSLMMPCVFCVMDVMIATIMSLQYRKAKTGYGDSNRILEVLINVVVRNGVLVAFVMIIQFIVTFTAVLWGNFLPLAYGKLHAITVLCILTEPRLAHSKWREGQDGPISAEVGQVQTPHMDYSRPGQQHTTYLSTDGQTRRRRHSAGSTDSRRRSDLLPFDGDGYEERDTPSFLAHGSTGRRPPAPERKISAAPTASSGHTALNPDTPPYELPKDDVELGRVEGKEK